MGTRPTPITILRDQDDSIEESRCDPARGQTSIGALPAALIATAEIPLSITDSALHATLQAAPQEGDPEGSASPFVGNHESPGKVQDFAGTITGVIADTPYSGDFREEPHAGHAQQ